MHQRGVQFIRFIARRNEQDPVQRLQPIQHVQKVGQRDAFGMHKPVEILQQYDRRRIFLGQMEGIADDVIDHIRFPQYGDEFCRRVVCQRFERQCFPSAQAARQIRILGGEGYPIVDIAPGSEKKPAR